MDYRKILFEEISKKGSLQVADPYIGSAHMTELSLDDLDRLMYVPDVVLSRLIKNVDCVLNKMKDSGYNTLDTFLATAASMDLLSFVPYVTEDKNGAPMLVLKYNRYVHLFRGYHFQCSYTHDCIGEYRSASNRLDVLRRKFSDWGAADSKAFGMLCYMNLINCCTGMASFDKMLKNNSTAIDKFVNDSVRYMYRSHTDVCYADLLALFNCEGFDKHSLSDVEDWYRLPASDTSDYLRLHWEDTRVIVHFMDDTKPHYKILQFPLLKELVGITDEEDLSDFSQVLLSSIEFKSTLVGYALNSIGYVVNNLVTYPVNMNEVTKLLALNRQLPEFKSLATVK